MRTNSPACGPRPSAWLGISSRSGFARIQDVRRLHGRGRVAAVFARVLPRSVLDPGSVVAPSGSSVWGPVDVGIRVIWLGPLAQAVGGRPQPPGCLLHALAELVPIM